MSSATVSVEPIAYPINDKPSSSQESENVRAESAGGAAFCVRARSLSRMLKEALVSPLGPGRSWRMLSDEGPYLNGTDLAPFPLGFFAAGLQFSFLEQIVRRAASMDVEIESLECAQDTWYTMEGSALRGNMLGGAKSAEIAVKIGTSAPPETLAALLREAEQGSSAHALMREPLKNTFALHLNGAEIPVTGVAAAPRTVADPAHSFTCVESDEEPASLQPIISKVSEARKVRDVEGGVGSSLKSAQRRTLHVRSEGRILPGRFLETQVQLLSPIGSRFRFLGQVEPDAGEESIAPPSLGYLSAGVAFCFLTQLGRYAHIVKQPLRSYAMVQFSGFREPSESQPAGAEPMDTHLFVEGDLSRDAALACLRMSEQTCFLHAAMRGSFPTRLSAEQNGQPLPLHGRAA